MNTSYLVVEESGHSVFCDAMLATESGSLVFASLWGRDTGVQQLLSRWTLGDVEGGSATMTLLDPKSWQGRYMVAVDQARLKKHTGRRNGTLLGDLVHVFVYDSSCLGTSCRGRRLWLLDTPLRSVDIRDQLWQVLQNACPLPLLNAWKDWILDRATERGWVRAQKGFQMAGYLIDVSDLKDVEDTVSAAVKAGALRLDLDEETALVA